MEKWTVTTDQYRYKYWIEDENKIPVAGLFHCGTDCIDQARLIAAAPDLLEACKYAFENLSPKGNIKKDFSGHNAMATLSRAIAKSEGKEV